jgi:hypothetical protein
MNEKKRRLTLVFRSLSLLCILFLASCGGRQTAKDEPIVSVSVDPKLDAPYSRALVPPVEIASVFAGDYPGAAAECRAGFIEQLAATKSLQATPVDATPGKPTGPNTLVVKLNITDMRIASRSARFWGGAFVGSSHMIVKMTVIDGHTGKVIRDKEFSTSNNAFAASFALNDEYLPRDMGRIIGEYIIAVMP